MHITSQTKHNCEQLLCYHHIFCSKFHRWLIHKAAVACGNLSQGYEWISAARQARSVAVHLSTRELFLALALPSKRDSLVYSDRVNWGGIYPWWWIRCSLTSAGPLTRAVWFGAPSRLGLARWNHSVVSVRNLLPVLITASQLVCCVYFRLFIHKVQMPFSSANAHSGWHHDMRALRGKLFPFNQQLIKFNVSFTSTSPHTVILVIDGWIQMNVIFCRRRTRAWFCIA